MGSGISKQLVSLNSRVSELEGNIIPQFITAIERAFKVQGSRLENSDKVMMAIIELLGEDVVSAKIEEQLKRKLQENSDKGKVALEAAINEGKIIPSVGAISEKTLIVGKELTVNGEVVFPGRLQATLEPFTSEDQALLLGKRVGDIVDLSNGGKLEIQELYEEFTLPEANTEAQAV